MDFLRAKAEGRKLSMVTCYDYTFARLRSKSPIDGILVGDSAAMVMHRTSFDAFSQYGIDAPPHGGGRAQRSGQIHRHGHHEDVVQRLYPLLKVFVCPF